MVLRCVGNISIDSIFTGEYLDTYTERKILEYTRLENIYPVSLHGPVPSVHVHMFSLIYIHQPFIGYIHKSVRPFVILKHCWKVAFVLIVCLNDFGSTKAFMRLHQSKQLKPCRYLLDMILAQNSLFVLLSFSKHCPLESWSWFCPSSLILKSL